MKYPQPRSIGSTLFPKLLGCYERELYPYIVELSYQDYTEIIDIGCAEGYYAIGMSLLFSNATVYAYDTNDEAIHLCKEMARLNGVEERLVFRSFFDLDEFRRIRFRGKGLVFSDCEGYEKHLFNQDSVELFSPHDLIIETHDEIDGTISEICNAFENSHEISCVQSLSDTRRLKTYRYKELERYDIATKYRLIRECRSDSSQWLILKSRT